MNFQVPINDTGQLLSNTAFGIDGSGTVVNGVGGQAIVVNGSGVGSSGVRGVGNGSGVAGPVNVYRVSASPHTGGWIILCVVLGLIIMALLFVLAFSLNNCENQCHGCTCFGPYGVLANTSAATLDGCGTGANEPCTFVAGSLLDSQQICTVWASICQAFTYNPRTSTMNIVAPTNTFPSNDPQINLYIRQSGTT